MPSDLQRFIDAKTGVYLGSGGKNKDGSVRKTPISAARGTVCTSNLQQVRAAIQTLQIGDEQERFPQSLTELKLPSEFYACPDGKEPYPYDPNTGRVSCVHPGHEKF